jgi:hypothetical protein
VRGSLPASKGAMITLGAKNRHRGSIKFTRLLEKFILNKCSQGYAKRLLGSSKGGGLSTP